jgi:hypothetical protein
MSDHALAKSRRNFIRNGFTSLAGVILAPSVFKKGKKPVIHQEKDRKFIYRTLGKTGIKLPIVSMGSRTFKLMRSYMYAFGYHSPWKARETLDHIKLASVPCLNCESCSVKCSSGFDIKRKATDIARILDVPKEFLV